MATTPKILLLAAPMKLTIVCAWCDKLMRQGDSQDAPISHGICDLCLLKHFGLTKEELRATPSTYDHLGPPIPPKR